MTISGYDCWKRKGLSQRQKLETVSAKTTSSGSPFQIRGPEMLKVEGANSIRRPQKYAWKNGKISKIYGKIALKLTKFSRCTVVV